MPRRSRIRLEFDIKRLIRDIEGKFKELPDNFDDLANPDLYRYEKALKVIVRELKPYTFD